MSPKLAYESPFAPLPPRRRRGLLIAIDGLDGTGLSTQASRLCTWLEKSGREVHATKEPTSGPAGAMIRLALMKRLGVAATTRASLACYSTRHDIDALVAGLGKVRKVFR